ncbi:MAG: GGDEF domain-containing protein [Lachnospiraceae bacterium]|nr:GGDEF domain-containing protein [Lachnospiraceae bacterium]
MNSVIVFVNLISALFIFIIIIGLYQVPQDAIRLTRHFRYCMWACFAGLLTEMAAHGLNGLSEYGAAVFAFNLLSFILIDCVIVFYGFYFYYLITQTDKSYPKTLPNLTVVLCAIDICFSIVGAITGKLFKIVDGSYVAGPWSPYSKVIGGICFIATVVVFMRYHKAFGITSPMVTSLFVIVPLLSFVILAPQAGDIRNGFVGAAASLAVVYVIVQSRIIAEATANAELYNTLSTHDILTGLGNRRGYQAFVGSNSIKGEAAAVFADVNSLKEANDRLGHEAGDKLIVKSAEILKNAFPDGKVFRVSGDEFVCIIENATRDTFTKRMDDLAALIYDGGRYLSVGYSVGDGSDILDLVKKAEQVMYMDKSRYYKETGKDRRH